MGTRSLTFVYDDNNLPLVCMYGQYDGYPSGHGAQLADILAGREIVNGFGSQTPQKASNGMGCLAATIIAEFKTGIGNYYIYPADTDDAGQDYEYHIYSKNYIMVKDHGQGEIFTGSWCEFADWCKIDEE